jgi:hypothetical protein
MQTHSKPRQEHSPFALLTELAVEATSSLVEAQRTLLNLAQEENEIFLNGVKEQIGSFVPGIAMTELVRRSVDTVIAMQQELLTTTSKQTLQWLESERTGKADRTARLIESAHEAVETFTRAQKKFLDVVSQEAVKAVDGKEHETKPGKKTEIAHLAGKAAHAFIEAQKKLLDVMGQQMNVNLDVTTRSMELMKVSRLLPMANLTGEGLKNFLDTEKSLLGSFITSAKKVAPAGPARHGKRAKAVAV